MNKFFSFLFLIFLSHLQANAQKLFHSLGTSISVLSGKINTQYLKELFSIVQTNLTYFPRFNIIESENSSVSMGFPVGAGIGIVDNAIEEDAGIAFSYDLPAVIDYNIGCLSTKENKKRFGGYFGAGFGYSRINISKSQFSDFTGTTYGPIFRGGMRFFLPKEKRGLQNLSVGIFYKKGLEKAKLSTFGFNILSDL